MAKLNGLPVDLVQATRRAFGKKSPLITALPGFAPRETQRHLATAIAETILHDTQLVAEAGTGTGKTFAYLVPSLLSGKKILISTATKMLQDQLVNKDLPQLMQALRLGVRVQNLKGRANYLCEHRIRYFSDEARFVDRQTAHSLTVIREKFSQLEEGVREELPEIAEDAPVWPFATSTADNCLGGRCAYYQTCFLVKARRRAMDAELVVVNHHLFFADARLKDDGFGALLPGVQVVIFDEAHQLAEIASDFFGHRLSTRMLGLWRADVAKEWPVLSPAFSEVQALLAELETVEEAMKAACQSGMRFHMDAQMKHQDFQLAWQSLRRILRALSACFEDAGIVDKSKEEEGLYQCHIRLNAFEMILSTMDANTSDYIAWGEKHQHHVVCALTPMRVATHFSKVMTQLNAAKIWTSATLTVAGAFDGFMAALGIEEAQTIDVPSPFDYTNQGLLYLPRGLPDPRSERYYPALLESMVPLITACHGRCFFLFTSHEALNWMAAHLPAQVSYPVLVQGTESKSILLARFRALGNAVLLGTATFWEGVDVQGAALSCVMIDKLPFMNPSDPVIQAKGAYFSKLGQSGFAEYSLPAAVIALKQGVGRLIRGDQDKGIIVIADPRLTGRQYGAVVFKSLPAFQRTREWHKVLAFAEGLS